MQAKRKGCEPRVGCPLALTPNSKRSELELQNMQNCVRQSELELALAQERPQIVHPAIPRLRGSASLRALNPMVMTKQAGGCAG
eukprot:6521315-Alexandrium_andersonii.AAC.1